MPSLLTLIKVMTGRLGRGWAWGWAFEKQRHREKEEREGRTWAVTMKNNAL